MLPSTIYSPFARIRASGIRKSAEFIFFSVVLGASTTLLKKSPKLNLSYVLYSGVLRLLEVVRTRLRSRYFG